MIISTKKGEMLFEDEQDGFLKRARSQLEMDGRDFEERRDPFEKV